MRRVISYSRNASRWIEVRDADFVVDGVGAGRDRNRSDRRPGLTHRLDTGFDGVVLLFGIGFDVDFPQTARDRASARWNVCSISRTRPA